MAGSPPSPSTRANECRARPNDYNRRRSTSSAPIVPGPAGATAEESAIARQLRDYATALPAGLMWLLASVLPSGLASRTGSALLGALGPRLRKHRQVLRNLHQVLPNASPAELERTARGVWRNLGAVLFEYPHLEHIVDRQIEVRAPDSVRALLEEARPMLLMTGHLANWEVLASFLGRQGNGLVIIYSPHGNPVIDRMIQRFRTRSGGEYVPKQQALRRLTQRFLKGRSVGLLPDVRVDSGVPLELFGTPAPTTISPARMAARLDYPVVPVRVKRLGPARFEVEFSEPLVADAEHRGKRAAIDLMAQFNALLEGWIGERPQEWLCTKRRWPKGA